MKYNNIREEELKNKVGAEWFKNFDTTVILGNIDFSLFAKDKKSSNKNPLLWAEAKTGDYDIITMFVQLILTIGKARTFDKTFPPHFLGAFDFKKIAFVSYISVHDIFYLNDFNWNVTPSNHETKEFQLIKERVEKTLNQNTYIFDYENDEKELKYFIANNIAKYTESAKIKIDNNNFYPIYLRWLDIVKPTIEAPWDDMKKINILDSDFYLADLFVDDKNTDPIDDDETIKENLFVIFQKQGYKIAKENLNLMFDATINIRDKEIYQNFWKQYKRPPIQKFRNYIIERRDLLVPQDIRERKGAFFTPRIWVELSQKYLTDYLGQNWQDEYYIWDCAAGTGNLLAGLTNKYNIFASTLDQADVNVMHERIDQGANLLKNHVFQFDFLNDEFTKLPQSLQNIINDPEKRKKLVVYINPPYAEASNAKTNRGTGENRTGVSNTTKVYDKYQSKIGTAARELFAQFLTRIYVEIPNCKIANFSTLKNLQSSNFKDFRNVFQAKLERIFLTPSDTFDNVKGKFPIGFFIYNTEKIEDFDKIIADIFDSKAEFIGTKNIYSYKNDKYIIQWLRNYYDKKGDKIAYLRMIGTDMQNNRGVFITNGLTDNDFKKKLFTIITKNNVIEMCIYSTVRHTIGETWLNDRDQFLFPNDGWQTDKEFQNDCLTYTIFNTNIQSKFGTNHWIPFTEQEVNAKEKFESNFMTNFIKGKLKAQSDVNLFGTQTTENKPLEFSEEAKEVFDAGRKLWFYYHQQKDINVNASLYDIKEYFQGRNDKGRMNTKSTDEKYTQLIGALRDKLNILAQKISPEVYEYGFLKE